MKNISYFLGFLSIVTFIAFLIYSSLSDYDNPGYVLMGFGRWSLETSLVIFYIVQVFVFFILYVSFRLLGVLFRLPTKLKQKRKDSKFNRSQEALISGLVDSITGNWEKAEKTLIKHASNNNTSLLHYLTAAKAAQSRGAIKKRDEYLSKAKAKSQSGKSDMAVGLTQAELYLSTNQLDEALETLTQLQSIDPGHTTVLKLRQQTYQQLGDWESLSQLIPSLQRHKVLMGATLKLLEIETFSHLLTQAAKKGGAADIQQLWQSMPKHIQAMQELTTVYFAVIIKVGAGAEIEQAIVKSIVKNWDETLLVLYAYIETEDYLKQLKTAEKWLSAHSDSAVLLSILGKISIKCGQMEKAKQYLKKSADITPTVAVYQMLGDVLMSKDDTVGACDYYQQGLKLANSEIAN